MPLSPLQRRRFDSLLQSILDELPDQLHDLLEEVPLIIEDEPSERLLRDMKINPGETDLCGLHWGVALTQRSVEAPTGMPDRMMLFRGPIMRTAGRRRDELEEQIRITLLHEIGHHFGLDEDDLAELGYA
ncbi:MAG: metallopeptidase family protein [Planctomycetota bacterium]|nr:metallopeptidase family protein [Planctomycetota bacterium]